SETARLLLQLLERVVEKEGTGWRARIPGVRVAGKTGTSQKVNQNGGDSPPRPTAPVLRILPPPPPRPPLLGALAQPQNGGPRRPVSPARPTPAPALVGPPGARPPPPPAGRAHPGGTDGRPTLPAPRPGPRRGRGGAGARAELPRDEFA